MSIIKLQTNIPHTGVYEEYKGEKEGNYGVQYLYVISGDLLYATENVHKQLQKFNVGDRLTLLKTEKGQKKFINVTMAGDIQAQTQNIAQPATKEVIKEQKYQDSKAKKDYEIGLWAAAKIAIEFSKLTGTDIYKIYDLYDLAEDVHEEHMKRVEKKFK